LDGLSLNPTPTLQATFLSEDGFAFEIYAWRALSRAEIESEVALFRLSRRRKLEAGHTYRIFTTIKSPWRKT
jgi:hypothetical protein